MECELKLAIESGDVARAKKLLRENPSLINYSLLCTAARTGSYVIVQELISRFKLKPNLTETNADDWTALQLASRGGHHKVVRLLLATCLPRLPTQQNRVQSCKRPSSRSCSSELCREAVGALNKSGRTALHVAAIGGHHTVVELLLPHCSESTLNAMDSVDYTALSLAAFGGHLKVVQLLLAENPISSSSLSIASARGHDKVVKLLLDHYPEERDREMGQAVYLAVLHGAAECVRLLIEARPELIRDELFVEATSRSYWEVFLVLLDKCESVREGSKNYVCELLAKKTDSRDGLTILHQAFRANNAPDALIPRLMEFEWQQQTSVDPRGNTLLHDAVRSKYFNSRVLEKVLAMDPTALQRTNKNKNTPFDVAACWKYRWPKAELMLRLVSLENIMEHLEFALARVHALLEEFVRPPLLLLGLHRDVVGIVCDYSDLCLFPL